MGSTSRTLPKIKERHSIPYAVRVALLWMLAVGAYLLFSAVMGSYMMALFFTLLCVGMTANLKHVESRLRRCGLNAGGRFKRPHRYFTLVGIIIFFLYVAYAIILSKSRANGTEFHEQMVGAFMPITSSLEGYIPRARNLAYKLASKEDRGFAIHAVIINHIIVAMLALIAFAWIAFRVKHSSFKEYLDSSAAFNSMALPFDAASHPILRFLYCLFISSGSCFGLYIYEFHLGSDIDLFRAEIDYFILSDFAFLAGLWGCATIFIPNIIFSSRKIFARNSTEASILEDESLESRMQHTKD